MERDTVILFLFDDRFRWKVSFAAHRGASGPQSGVQRPDTRLQMSDDASSHQTGRRQLRGQRQDSWWVNAIASGLREGSRIFCNYSLH